ncbi:MAG TPA: replicative DNA helicase [Pyrinomonadaceae bacterium]|jgi:replicative DNA helicase
MARDFQANRDQFLERPLPSNTEGERAILGAILLDNSLINQAIEQLTPDDFYSPFHRAVFNGMIALFERGAKIDPILIGEELKKEGKLESYGGVAAIANLTYGLPHFNNIHHYAKLVSEKALARNLIKACNTIVSEALAEEDDAEIVLDRAEQLIFALANKRTKQSFVAVRPVAEDVFVKVQEYAQRKDASALTGLTTGYRDLDSMTSGMQRNDLIIVAARPSMGKTAFCLNIAQRAALQADAVVGFFSLEMSKEQLVMRMLCSEAMVDAHRFRNGFLSRQEWERLGEALGRLAETKIFIDDTPGISVLEMRAKARRLAAEQKRLDLIIVDYMQLMTGGNKRIESRQQEVSQISRELKGLAKELNVPLIALSQLSRAAENRSDHKPQLSDLRESGCLTGDSLITLAETGEVIPISHLIRKSGFKVWALNKQTWKLEKAVVSNAFSTGRKSVFRLRTRLGRIIRATANHKFLAFAGWKRLDELQTGEFIALPRRISNSTEQTMSFAELGLLGHLIGDGCTLPRHAIQYTTREKDLAETVASLAVEIFGDEVKPRIKEERQWLQVYLSSTRRHTHNVRSAVAEWLESLGIWGLRSHQKFVPEKVFHQPETGIACFLRHLWATDGSVRLVQGKKARPRIYYASSSERLARDVQSLLLRLGINARLRTIPQSGKGRDQYHVIISGKSDLETFVQKVGAVGRYKTESLNEIAAFMANRIENTNRDVIPNTIWREAVVPAMTNLKMTTRQMMEQINTAYCGTGLYKQNLSRSRALRVAQVVSSDYLSALAESDVYWDEIVSIEFDGEEEVYDLTVDKLHNFVANDIIVHNSIEQDADVVAFIFREEYYKPTDENFNQAEIIIAKQRNGPTGAVTLTFIKELTRFEDLYRGEGGFNE